MKLIEKKMNLFEVDDKYYLAHCISQDAKMGAGIAVDFQHKFKLRNKILIYQPQYPCCIQIGRVFNLITKKYYYNKPTYNSFTIALQNMKNQIEQQNIKYLAIYKLGCARDRLQWSRVRSIIQDVFTELDLEILVCKL